jgi:hypothetical protein
MVKQVNVIRKGLSSYLKTNADLEWIGRLRKHKASGAIKPKGLNRIAKIG